MRFSNGVKILCSALGLGVVVCFFMLNWVISGGAERHQLAVFQPDKKMFTCEGDGRLADKDTLTLMLGASQIGLCVSQINHELWVVREMAIQKK